MARARVGAVVAVVIAILTGAAYVVSTNHLRDEIRAEVESRVGKAQDLLEGMTITDALDLMKRADDLARDEGLGRALAAADPGAREQQGKVAIRSYLDGLQAKHQRPDFVAVVTPTGEVLSDTDLPDTEGWKTRFKAVAAALDNLQPSKDVWSYGKSIVKVGIAPALDPATGKARGAVVMAYAMSGQEAQEKSTSLGTEIAYFYGDRLVATSFKRASDVESVGKATSAYDGRPMEVVVEGERYLAARAPLPMSYEDKQAAAVVLESLDHALAPIRTVGTIVLLLGFAALIVALLAIVAVARGLLHQAEEIESGVTEVINGNTEFAFKPVGADFDGLASSLNVMLARLLGRPDPSEDGDLSDMESNGKVLLDEEAAGDDADSVALAEEPEADYHRRLFAEYVAARQAAGERTEGVAFEGFIAKLRLSEANLKKRYGSRAVRFRVQSKGGQVTLKPVPIM